MFTMSRPICLVVVQCYLCVCSKLYAYLDSIYYATSDGRKFRSMCQYAHKVAYELIGKRKKALVRSYCLIDVLF